MLDELHVVNVGVIDDLTIQMKPGMTVISGETGAGKTLIVDALLLLGGVRADLGIIRSGSTFAKVEARFVEDSNDELIISRQLESQGASRAYVNGNLSRVGDLARVTENLIHIYGQHESQSLFSPEAQAQILDCYASIDFTNLDSLTSLIKSTKRKLSELGGDERSREREMVILNHELDELRNADLHDVDEEDALHREIQLLSNSLEIRESLSFVRSALIENNEDGFSAMDLLGEARRHLQHLDLYPDLEKSIDSQILILREIGSEITAEFEQLESDPLRLDELQNRLALIGRLKRRYGETLADVIEYQLSIEQRIKDLESFELVAMKTEQEIDDLEANLRKEESKILALRRDAADRMSKDVIVHLKNLAIANAQFFVDLGDSGIGDPVIFMFSANVGERARPVAKVASGGELSRIMLALRLISASSVPTMIFDEVDAGIGGGTAIQIGKALADLSKSHQVIVVTHLAQVACYADHHIAIEKHQIDDQTMMSGSIVTGELRLTELARMLSGHSHSEKARQHAKELLRSAGNTSY